jgi:hypothetical protein
MRSPKDEIVLKTRVTMKGVINGEPLAFAGRAILEPFEGITRGRYVIDALPRRMDPRILSAFSITGYSNSSRNYPGAINPFRGVSYGYERTVTFEDGKVLDFKAYCKVEEDGSITSDFNLNGEVDVPPLTSMEPLVEAWVPIKPGEIYGNFTPTWISEKGERIVATAVTRYHLEVPNELPCRHHRYITILTQFKGNLASKYQKVTLHTGLPFHEPGEVTPLDFASYDDIDKRVEELGTQMREDRLKNRNLPVVNRTGA